MDEVFQLLDYLGIQSQSTIQTYASLAQRRHLKKGECLYYGGEDSTNLYFLISGILRGFTVSAGGKEYTECILHKYGHAHIGMIGMDNRQEFKLNKNLEALTEADLIYFDVRPIIKELPNSIEFLRVYVKKLEESYAQMWEVREIMRVAQEPVSLETPIGEEEDSHLGDFIPDEDASEPAEAASFTLLKEQLVEVLSTLTPREEKVLKLRFGIEDGRTRTLEEVGKEFNVTRERIRQIEAKALRKLRHPSRSKKLKDFLN